MNNPRKRLHIASQEIERLQRVLDNRKARVKDAERKLAEAKERAKTEVVS